MVIETTRNGQEQAADAITGQAPTASGKDLGQAQLTREHTERTMDTTTAKLEKGRIVNDGMGGFLNPPGHPEHGRSVETDLRRRPENRGRMSLSAAVESAWLDNATRGAARRVLQNWQRPALDSPEVQAWILQVLGYFRGCYSGQNAAGEQSWSAGELRISTERDHWDPMLNMDIHAGVHLIRGYYPEFVPTAGHFAQAKWGA